MISKEEDILELYVIELQPKCWSICSTLKETKEIDTPRTLCFGSAEVYRNEAIADRHCKNIIKGGKFVNAKVVPLHFTQEPKLDSNVEEAINQKIITQTISQMEGSLGKSGEVITIIVDDAISGIYCLERTDDGGYILSQTEAETFAKRVLQQAQNFIETMDYKVVIK